MGTALDLYSKLPRPAQNLLVSLKGLELRVRRQSDRRVREMYRFLEGSQHWTVGEHARYQERRLRALLERILREVPYYRERTVYRIALGSLGGGCDAREVLASLPVLSKQEVRRHQEELVNPTIPRRRCTTVFTSGSTGTPLELLETRRSFSERFAFVARLRSWAGLREPFHPRRVQFTGRDIVPDPTLRTDGVYWRHNLADRALLCSTTHVDAVTAPAYLAAMRAFQPELVDGYPSAIGALARLGLSLELRFPRPRAIITTAETLGPEDRRVIEEAFGCRVFDQYAASEPSCFWCECEHGTMHVNPEYGISELLDDEGKPVASGEEGAVVVTSFLNPVTPLLRYRVGDRAVLSADDRCPCAREMPRIQELVGREDDVLYVPGRGYVGRLDPVFKGVQGVVEAQIVQESLDSIRLRVVPGDECDWAITREILVQNLRRKIGPSIRLDVERVPRIERGPNGKLRAVISLVGPV